MKLTKDEKEYLKDLKLWIEQQGGKIVVNKALRMVTAYIPVIPGNKQSRFVHASFSYCSDSDKWNKKRGELIAAERLYYGQFAIMPE